MSCFQCRYGQFVNQQDQKGFCLWQPVVKAASYDGVVHLRMKATDGSSCPAYDSEVEVLPPIIKDLDAGTQHVSR